MREAHVEMEADADVLGPPYGLVCRIGAFLLIHAAWCSTSVQSHSPAHVVPHEDRY